MEIFTKEQKLNINLMCQWAVILTWRTKLINFKIVWKEKPNYLV